MTLTRPLAAMRLMAIALGVAACDFTVGFRREESGGDGGQSEDGGRPQDAAAPPEDCGCPDTFEPYCGADDLTYQNGCELACAEQAVACQGECPCDCGACITLWDPVCGADGITYQNGCFLGCAGVALGCEQECPCPCGGFAGNPCPAGFSCLDDLSDDCDPVTGGGDCPGLCGPEDCGDGIVRGIVCPEGYQCVDDRGGGCDPTAGLRCHCV